MLKPVANRLAEEADRIGNLITSEMGKSTKEAQGEASMEQINSQLNLKMLLRHLSQ